MKPDAMMAAALMCLGASAALAAPKTAEQRAKDERMVGEMLGNSAKEVQSFAKTSNVTPAAMADRRLPAPGNVAQYSYSASGAGGAGDASTVPSLPGSYDRAKAALEGAAKVVAAAKGADRIQDGPNTYVRETGNKVVALLGGTVNSSVRAANEDFNRARLLMQEVWTIAAVINANTGSGQAQQQQQPDPRDAAAADGQRNVLRRGRQARSTAFFPLSDAAGQEIRDTIGAREVALAEMGMARLRELKAVAARIPRHIEQIPPAMKEAQDLAKTLAANDAKYRAAMKGAESGSAKSRAVLMAAVGAVGEHAMRMHETAREMSEYIDGPLGNAMERVFDCARATLSMAEGNIGDDGLDPDASFARRQALIQVAYDRNVSAVYAVRDSGPGLRRLMARLDRELPDQPIRLPGFQSLSAPMAGQSPTMDGGLVQEGARKGMKPMEESGSL